MASRSRPPSLLSSAYRLVRDRRLFGREDLVLCACSGGPDSIALLHVLALLRRRIGHRLCAVGIDHGLRAEAAGELALAVSLARACEVDFLSLPLRLAPGSNLQDRARRARHAALQREARRLGAVVVALGHTADDRAETVMMRLLRGAGPRGLAVMPPRAPSPTGEGVDLVRPLATARRADVIAHLDRHRLRWAEDPSNRDARFVRARVRAELMPLLCALSPGIVGHLCALADMLAADAGRDDPLAGLGRAQRQAVERALALGRRGTTVRVRGGRDLAVAFSGRTPVVSGGQ
jgi:tRNA(Ile)-lysidine synthase